MNSIHRPSPLRTSDSTWVTSRIIDSPSLSSSLSLGPRPSSSLDLVPAPRASDLQIILRTRDQTAYYDPSSNELSLQKRMPSSETSEPGSTDAPLVPHRSNSSPSQSLLQRFTRSLPPAASHKHEPICPTCARPWPIPRSDGLEEDFDHRFEVEVEDDATPGSGSGVGYDRESPSYIAPNYFRLLAQATTTISATTSHHHSSTSQTHIDPSSRPDTPTFLPRNRFESASGTSTPGGASTPPHPSSDPDPIPSTSSAQGYYSRFFIQLHPLGRGARGQVFLCQHILNGNKLGKYAIKKIPVGDHASSLLQSLNEVHLMETLHHPHLIHYQHAWIERCRLSKFQPEVPTLFVLMMAANGGSLADWISARAGEKGQSPSVSGEQAKASSDAATAEEKVARAAGSESPNPADRRKIERLKAALRQRRANRHPSSPPPPPSSSFLTSQSDGGVGVGVGVHLLRTEEIYSLLTDIVSGLSFLHNRGILHLDIKPGNVLLHWDEDCLIPRALVSDFGSSLLLHDNWTRTRSGHTGTMEYMSPETVIADAKTGKLRELSAKADIWSVGMILHLLLFFRLPYGQTADVERLRVEMEHYAGFKRDDNGGRGGGRGDEVLLGLLERMLNVDPGSRPSCEEILAILNEAKKNQGGKRRGGGGRRGSRYQPDGAESRKGEAGAEGVSLALYRPSALPPLPPPLLGDRRHASSKSPWNLFAEVLLPTNETRAIAVALVKCLSPTILTPHIEKQTERIGLMRITASTLITLLALVDLSSFLTSHHHHSHQNSARGRGRGRVSAFCWIAHLSLLLVVWWADSL